MYVPHLQVPGKNSSIKGKTVYWKIQHCINTHKAMNGLNFQPSPDKKQTTTTTKTVLRCWNTNCPASEYNIQMMATYNHVEMMHAQLDRRNIYFTTLWRSNWRKWQQIMCLLVKADDSFEHEYIPSVALQQTTLNCHKTGRTRFLSCCCWFSFMLEALAVHLAHCAKSVYA